MYLRMINNENQQIKQKRQQASWLKRHINTKNVNNTNSTPRASVVNTTTQKRKCACGK